MADGELGHGTLGLPVRSLRFAKILVLALASAAALHMGTSRLSHAAELRVVATIKPVHSLVAQVLDGIATPDLLVDGQASPHSFALKPSDARALDRADIVVRVGPTVEPFMERIVETLSANTSLVTLTDASGMTLLKARTGTHFEPHAHEHGDAGDQHAGHDEQKHEHHTQEDHAHEQHERGIDGHIWLGPENAKAIVKVVADAVVHRRPDLKDKVIANSEKAIREISALDEELRAILAPVASKPFIVFHDAYQYFEAHYGLEAAGAITLNPEVKPSARRITEIRETLASTKAACVFAEPQFSPRIIATVIESTNAKAGTLDPLGAPLPAGPAQYAAVMRALANSMVGCLEQ